jgi:small subunit ribosomal protein S5
MTEEKKEVIKNQSEKEVSKKVEDAKKNDESNSLNEKILSTKKTEEKKPEKTNDTSNLSNNKADKKSSEKLTSSKPVASSDKKKDKLSVKLNKTNDSKDKNTGRKENENSESIEQNELQEKLVSINRVAKVVKGGRRFSFAALVVVGDGNGMVGHGKGKAKEVPEAIKKATDEAKNNMIRVPLRQGRTLHHDIKGRYDAGKVYLRSAPSGTGVIAGGPMRAVFEALGIQDIVAKSVGTSNPHNMVRATFEALKSASSPKIIAMRRGLKINDITKRRKINQSGLDNGKN